MPSDEVNCQGVRSLVNDVDWECDLKILFQTDNLGCEKAVTAAINWFFAHTESGIILEDDCVASPSFFEFCAAMLQRYESDQRVGAITGNNFQRGNARTEFSYYFSKYPHCWGWATWKRAWAHYDFEMRCTPCTSDQEIISRFANVSGELAYWSRLFSRVRSALVNTWDYRWVHSLWKHEMLTVTPTVNLVRNIGFDDSGTHTSAKTDMLLPANEALPAPYAHPHNVRQDIEADGRVARTIFRVPRYRHQWLWRNLGMIAYRILSRFQRQG